MDTKLKHLSQERLFSQFLTKNPHKGVAKKEEQKTKQKNKRFSFWIKNILVKEENADGREDEAQTAC